MDNGETVPISTDTDSLEVRQDRAKRQYGLEKELDENTKGRSWIERFFWIRDRLFGDYQLIRNDKPNQLIRDGRIRDYPESDLLGQELVPAMVRFVDDQEDRIAGLSSVDEKSEQGFRLATLAYFAGILAHQAPDGNGQTNRLISLSYIRQFCPDQKDKFLPIKYGKEWGEGESMRRFSSGLREGVNWVVPADMSQEDFDLIRFAWMGYREVGDRIGQEIARRDEAGEKTSYDAIAEPLFREYVEKMRSRGFPVSEEAANREFYGANQLDVYGEVEEVIEKKYPTSYFGIMGASDGKIKANVIRTLFGFPEGERVMQSYLEVGVEAFSNLTPEKDLLGGVSQVYRATAEALKKIEEDFNNLLEDQNIHEDKFRLLGVGEK